MDIRNYITFNAVVESEGFTKAAHRLSYAQSTVTLHIKELEKYYESLLFDRIGKKIYLTAFGKKLYIKSKKLEDMYNNIAEIDPKSEKSEVLRIGVYESLLRYRIQHLIHAFKQENPNIDMIMQHGTCRELRKMVREGELDMTFHLEPKREFRDLKVDTLCEEKFHMILPKGSDMGIVHKSNQTVYLTEKDCSYRLMFEDYLNKNDIIKYNVMETGSVDLIKQYVSFGQGYSLVPSITVKEPREQEGLELVEVDYGRPLFTQIAYHKDKTISKGMESFLDMLYKYAEVWRNEK